MTAAVVTVTEEREGGINKITFDVTTDSSAGTATASTVAEYTGCVERIVIDPASSGSSTQFSDGYAITLKDADGYDLLDTSGSSIASSGSATASDIKQFKSDDIPGVINNDKIALALSSAGNSKKGKVVIYIEDKSKP